jgi:hypothetical protein
MATEIDPEIGPAARKRMKDVVVVEGSANARGPEDDNQGAAGLSPEYAFDLDYTDRRGHRWQGAFRCRALTVKDRITVGLTRARLSANTPLNSIDRSTLNLLEMQAHLAVALEEFPTWAESLGDLHDVGVISAIYKEVADHEGRFWGRTDRS